MITADLKIHDAFAVQVAENHEPVSRGEDEFSSVLAHVMQTGESNTAAGAEDHDTVAADGKAENGYKTDTAETRTAKREAAAGKADGSPAPGSRDAGHAQAEHAESDGVRSALMKGRSSARKSIKAASLPEGRAGTAMDGPMHAHAGKAEEDAQASGAVSKFGPRRQALSARVRGKRLRLHAETQVKADGKQKRGADMGWLRSNTRAAAGRETAPASPAFGKQAVSGTKGRPQSGGRASERVVRSRPDHTRTPQALSEKLETRPLEGDGLSARIERGIDSSVTETNPSRFEDPVKGLEMKSNTPNIGSTDGNFEEIVRQFTILVRKGGGEARMVLQPENLGSLKLKIQLDRGEIATSILVDNQAVKDLILSRLNILEEGLLKHGFDLGSFEVGVRGESGADEQARSDRAAQDGKGSGLAAVQPGDDGMYPDALQAQQLPWISTRVNITV
jgi:flagellar hook-length control protein FliK